MDGGEGLFLASSLSPKLELQLKWKAAEGFLDVAVLEDRPRASCMRGKHSAIELHPGSFYLFSNERGSRVAQAHLELPV